MYKYTFDVGTSIYITIFDISIQFKCVSIQYHCLVYHNMVIYQYIVASLVRMSVLCTYFYTDSKRCMRLMRICVIPKISEEWEAVAAYLDYSKQAKDDIKKDYE